MRSPTLIGEWVLMKTNDSDCYDSVKIIEEWQRNGNWWYTIQYETGVIEHIQQDFIVRITRKKKAKVLPYPKIKLVRGTF